MLEFFVMKRSTFFIGMLLGALLLVVTTQASAQKEKKTLFAPDDLKWEQLKGAPPGVMSAALRGDQTRGGYEGFTKFPAGFRSPMHYHTYATKIIVIKGAYTHNGKKYGPGSYLYIPGGDKHETAGAEDSESIFYIEQQGPFDLIPVEAAKTNK